MATDRLAALRAQRNVAAQQPSVAQPASVATNTTFGSFPPPQDGGAYEMATRQPVNGSGGDDMNVFYSEISSIQDDIRKLNDNVRNVAELRNRSLNTVDENVSRQTEAQVVALTDETSQLSTGLKRRIKALEREANGPNAQIKKQQTGRVKSNFIEAIQNYQNEEKKSREKQKARIERQFRIVKPEATQEEVQAVVNDDSGGNQVFQQALMSSNRYGESRAAYNEVQERHKDIQHIEKTLAELAQLFSDMSVLVEQQDETINTINTAAEAADKDLEVGLGHTDKAVESARAARRKRWICFWLTIIILVIIALAVGLGVGLPIANAAAKKNSSQN